MKIIILGAGQVGSTLANLLSQEDNDVTVVDLDDKALHHLEEEVDINTINGSCTFPSTLLSADIKNADMVAAVTGSDEINIVSCLISKILSSKVKTIARIRESSYLRQDTLKAIEEGVIPIDKVISPENLITEYIQALIETPGSLQVLEFGDGILNLVGTKAVNGGPLIGHEISDLKKYMPNVDTRVAAIFRDGNSIIPQGTTIIEAEDEVFFIARRKDAKKVINAMRTKEDPYKFVIIAGGGKIGSSLAERIEGNHRVKVIENNTEKAKKVSERLINSIVLEGNVSDKSLLHEESVEEADVFVAGQKIGKTPLQYYLDPSSPHGIVLKKKGYQDKTDVVSVSASRMVSKNYTLDKVKGEKVAKKSGGSKWLLYAIIGGGAAYAAMGKKKEEEKTGSLSITINIPN